MKITPLDIQQQKFKVKTFNGLDPEDVDLFLQSVVVEMENLVRENHELKEEQASHLRELAEMAGREKDLRETMLAAQRITEDMKANAQKEASLIISEAELKALNILSGSERQLGELQARIEDIRRQKIQFEISFKSMLESFARQLSSNEPV